MVAALVAVVVFLLVTVAQIAIERAGGRTSAFLPAYVLFLVVGFAISRIRTRISGATPGPPGAPQA